MFDLIKSIATTQPQLFRDLTYFFDPLNTLRPGFFQLFRLKDRIYLYLLRLDFEYRTHFGTVIENGGNDTTPRYRSSNLFIESDLIPVTSVTDTETGGKSVVVRQHLSDTWVGESGKGYFVQGIWIDRDLGKFFSKLFQPTGLKSYPYYPFPCKYQTVCHSLIDYSPEGRKKHLKLLYQAESFLEPHLQKIQSQLSKGEFSPELPLFQELKKQVPERWDRVWRKLQVSVYLNDEDMKEFRVAFQSE